MIGVGVLLLASGILLALTGRYFDLMFDGWRFVFPWLAVVNCAAGIAFIIAGAIPSS